MRKLALFFEAEKGKRVKNMIIGIGAAIVMMGALFKLEAWPGASVMLIIGLSVEAFIFALQGILPPHKDYYWEKIYPHLHISPEVEGETEAEYKGTITDQLNQMLEDANVESRLIERLGHNLGKLGDNVEKLAELGEVSLATNEYAAKAREATIALAQMKDAYSGATESIRALANATSDAQNFHTQMQLVTKNLASLNSIYEVELQDASKHIQSINSFYGTLAEATENLKDTLGDTKVYKEQIGSLAKNLSALNTVYGNMLSAMAIRNH
ncbi:MAG TPA: gliding motility protein GldL [Chitinophagales bacterium]|nr:gliding motility protein GldL [Chitinophagales bacterium]